MQIDFTMPQGNGFANLFALRLWENVDTRAELHADSAGLWVHSIREVLKDSPHHLQEDETATLGGLLGDCLEEMVRPTFA